MDIAQVIEEIKASPDYEGQIVHERVLEAREPQYAELRSPVSDRLRQVLEGLGIERLYSHQAEAVDRVLAGEHVTVVASTAGGKTLCYTIPVAEAVYERPISRAFLIFPTKALAQDQLRKLKGFGAGEVFTADCYDGDTPQVKRRRIRREAQVILTNPDMLHIGILPYHQLWADFLRSLKYVILDEVHIYRGVFGSHTAGVIRRLRRICRHYGADPQFICCSATIGNPGELAETLTGVPSTVVDNDGSPRGNRHFLIWNPPLQPRQAGRRSPNIEAATLMAKLARRGVRHITFTIARKVAELILQYAQRALREADGKLADRLMSYRGGYLPEERRDIERRLFEGELLGVTSTTALELGVDVGHLDATILTGYPGSIASTWQQAGRAGRGRRDSLSALVALPNAVDQYIVRQPDYLFSEKSEQAIIDPFNRYILAAHLLCAAYELPLDADDEKLFGSEMEPILEILGEARYVVHRRKWYWIGDGYPAAQTSIRSASGEGYDIVEDAKDARLLGTVDSQTAFMTVHEGAIYLHRGESYLVKRLDLEERTAYVRPTRAAYYTDPLVSSEVRVNEEHQKTELPGGPAWLGEVRVSERVTGYAKRRPFGEGTIGTETLDLPPQEFDTIGLWLGVSRGTEAGLAEAGADLAGGLHAVEHAMIALLPLFALCDPQDVGGVSHPAHPDLQGPGLFIYDSYPGGVGIAEAAFERLPDLMAATHSAIAECGCDDGCPQCVQSHRCGDMNWPLDKRGALIIAADLAGLDAAPPPERAAKKKRKAKRRRAKQDG